jgi:ABC-2 type transport system ATP-binding protein
MTAKENLELVCKIKGTPFEKVDEKLNLVGLLDRKNDKFKTFSLGMKQRLAIASALLNDPEILILDEPTNGLDPQGIRQIRDIIRVIASEGTTILLASHLLDEVEKVCSHVVVLQKGVMLYQGTVHDMIENNSFFELKSNNLEQLKLALQNHNSIEKTIEEEGKLLVYLKQDIPAQELNSYLFEQKIVLEHLVKRKNSLEEQFLELTNNK